MLRRKQIRKLAPSRERGLSLPEMAIGGMVFFTLVFGIIEVGRAMAAYNALSEAARRGARFACMNTAASGSANPPSNPSRMQVQNMVVFGTPTPAMNARPVASGLTTANVVVNYSGITAPIQPGPTFGMNSGSVRVEIRNYRFNFNVPLFGYVYTMRPFVATTNAESAGVIPGNI